MRKQVYVLWICIIYNTVLWISIIALWVNMFARLWIAIYSVMAVYYMATHDTIMDIHKDNSNLDVQTSLWISILQSWITIIGVCACIIADSWVHLGPNIFPIFLSNKAIVRSPIGSHRFIRSSAMIERS